MSLNIETLWYIKESIIIFQILNPVLSSIVRKKRRQQWKEVFLLKTANLRTKLRSVYFPSQTLISLRSGIELTVGHTERESAPQSLLSEHRWASYSILVKLYFFPWNMLHFLSFPI